MTEIIATWFEPGDGITHGNDLAKLRDDQSCPCCERREFVHTSAQRTEEGLVVHKTWCAWCTWTLRRLERP